MDREGGLDDLRGGADAVCCVRLRRNWVIHSEGAGRNQKWGGLSGKRYV